MNSLDVKHSLIGNIHLIKAINGYSAYDIACLNGFKGTEKEWLDSLNGYGIARLNGFKGTEEEWLDSLKGDKGDPGDIEMFGEFDALGHRVKNVALPQEDGDAVPYSTVKAVDISSDFIAEMGEGKSLYDLYAYKQVDIVTVLFYVKNTGAAMSGYDPLFTIKEAYQPKYPLCVSLFSFDGEEFPSAMGETLTGNVSMFKILDVPKGTLALGPKGTSKPYIMGNFTYVCK